MISVSYAVGFAGESPDLTEVAAAVYGKSDLRSIVVLCRSSLSAAEHAGVVGTADVELVIVSRESSEVACFDLISPGKLLDPQTTQERLTLTV